MFSSARLFRRAADVRSSDLARCLTVGEQRVQSFVDSDCAAWYHYVNITAHLHGGHFSPWEVRDEWTDDLRRTLRTPLDSQVGHEAAAMTTLDTRSG